MDTLSRIKTFVSSTGLSVSRFAEGIKMSQVTVNNYILGKRKISFELISAIASAYPDLSMEWLIRGHGEMYITPKIASESIEQLQNEAMPDIGREHYESMLQMMKQMQQQIDKLENKVG